MENKWSKFKSIRIIDGKLRNVIVDICGEIIDKNPIKKDLIGLKKESDIRTTKNGRRMLSEIEQKEYLLEFLRYFYEKEGRSPKAEDFTNNPKYPSFSIYQKVFGGWTNALLAAGLDNTRDKKYNREELIEKIQQWERENGRPPTAKELENNPKYPSLSPYRREFGTLNNAIREAVLIPGKFLTRKELIEKLQQWTRENGRPPVAKDFMNNHKYPSISKFLKEFGYWNNAKLAVGFKLDDTCTRGRQGELQILSEFGIGAVDLSGKDRHSSCDGICPKGEYYDVKSASLGNDRNGYRGWAYTIKINQIIDADYIFLRAYKDKDFTKFPKYRWRIPIELIEGKTSIFIYDDENKGIYNTKTMKKYEY